MPGAATHHGLGEKGRLCLLQWSPKPTGHPGVSSLLCGRCPPGQPRPGAVVCPWLSSQLPRSPSFRMT